MSAAKTQEEDNPAKETLVQKKSILTILIEEVNLICLPSSLWGIHLDSKHKFLAFSMLKITDYSSKTSKSVVLSETRDNILKTDVFMNNTSVQIPYISKIISNVEELNTLLNAIDAVKFCKYYSISNKENQCLIFNFPFTDVCSLCLQRACNTEQGLSKQENTDMNKLRDITFCNAQESCANKIDNNQCILCNKKFNKEEQLSAHYKTHLSKNNDGQFECSVCLKLFHQVNAVLEHYKEYHSSVKFIKCTKCDKRFTSVQRLKIHVRNHTGYEAFTCGRCNKDFISKQRLRKHTCIKSTRIHQKSKFYICKTCHTRFSTNLLLHQHQREHQLHVSLKCKKCKKIFENEDQAVDHKMHCKNKQLKYICKMCDQKFSCVSQRLCHIKKLHSS